MAVLLLAAATSGRFGRASLTVANDIVLLGGLAATYIGLVTMLQSLDDPRAIGPALSVAMCTSLYAALVKFGLEVHLAGDRGTVEAPGMHGWLAAGLALATLLAGVLVGSTVFAFLNFYSLLFLVLGAGTIVGLARVAGSTDVVGPLTRYLPFVGLLVLFGSILAMLRVLDNPASIGPFVAVGLLSHFYTNVTSMVLHLVRPDLAQPVRPVVQWLYWGCSLAGASLLMGLIVATVG